MNYLRQYENLTKSIDDVNYFEVSNEFCTYINCVLI